MSRREIRDSDSRHHRSRFDREPSPKRIRRDGRTATERPASNFNLDSAEHIDRDKKHHRRLQDSMPVESSIVPDLKIETVPLSKESDKKSNGHREGTKNSSDKIEAPRSRSLYQHDERAGRSFRHKETSEREGWKRSSKNDEKMVEPASKKRPSFRETKVAAAADDEKPATEATRSGAGVVGIERGGKAGEQRRMNLESRDRYGGWNRGRGQGQGQGQRVEKWKHDLYDEANKSPARSSKNEEDQIAKVEALLAS